MNSRLANHRTIDRSSYEPAYAQLAGILKEQVAKGFFSPGSQLPSEAHLCKNHNVSPMTVRRAINLLVDQGVVNTIQGKGTFVKPLDFGAIAFNLRHFQRLFADNTRTKVKFLEVRIDRADDRIAGKIDITSGSRVVRLGRLIFRDGEPVMYHRGYMVYDPTIPIIEGEMELTSLHGLFAGKGETGFKKGKLQLAAAVVDPEQARLLDLKSASPVMRLEHLFYDFKDRPISWGWFLFQSGLFQMETTIGLWDE